MTKTSIRPRREAGHDNSATTPKRTFTKTQMWGALNKWMRAATLADLGRGSTAIRVAVSIAYYSQRSESVSHYIKTGRLTAYPSLARLARELNVSEYTVLLAVGTLEDAGLVAVDRRRGEVNFYTLVPQRTSLLTTDTPQEDLAGGPPNLLPRNPPTTVGANNIPSKEGDYKPRPSVGGAGRSLGRRPAAPPQGRHAKLNTSRTRRGDQNNGLAKRSAKPPPSKYDELAARLPGMTPERLDGFVQLVSAEYDGDGISRREYNDLCTEAYEALVSSIMERDNVPRQRAKSLTRREAPTVWRSYQSAW